MSATLASGIIATLRTANPLTMIIRISVTVKYVPCQAATRCRKYSRTGRYAPQTIFGRTERLVSSPAATRPPETRMSGPASAAGCMRTVMHERSCGSRYRLTNAGTLAAGLTCLIYAPAGSSCVRSPQPLSSCPRCELADFEQHLWLGQYLWPASADRFYHGSRGQRHRVPQSA